MLYLGIQHMFRKRNVVSFSIHRAVEAMLEAAFKKPAIAGLPRHPEVVLLQEVKGRMSLWQRQAQPLVQGMPQQVCSRGMIRQSSKEEVVAVMLLMPAVRTADGFVEQVLCKNMRRCRT
jgi:endonuclease/exonuclease/phosphatase family metal-dependent hydrolase